MFLIPVDSLLKFHTFHLKHKSIIPIPIFPDGSSPTYYIVDILKNAPKKSGNYIEIDGIHPSYHFVVMIKGKDAQELPQTYQKVLQYGDKKNSTKYEHNNVIYITQISRPSN